MIFSFALITNIVTQALLLSLVGLGVLISFRILKFHDITGDSSFALAAVMTVTLSLAGIHQLAALVLGILTGTAAGALTTLITEYCKIHSLLAGIVVSNLLSSCALKLLGKPNIPFFGTDRFISATAPLQALVILTLLTGMLIIGGIFLLTTEIGLRFRALGLQRTCAEKLGVSGRLYTIGGIALANSMAGLSGILTSNFQGYVDISIGNGIVMHALASLMIGEQITGREKLNRHLFAPLIGALCYQALQTFALTLGLAPSDLKLVTGLLVLIVVVSNNISVSLEGVGKRMRGLISKKPLMLK